jgi:Ras family protein T1
LRAAREADQSEVDEEIQRADVMCIVYAVNDAASKASIRDNWLPRVRRLGVSVPIILVGNKVDLALTERSVNDLKREHEPIMNEYRVSSRAPCIAIYTHTRTYIHTVN